MPLKWHVATCLGDFCWEVQMQKIGEMQKFTSFGYSWSTNNEYKILDAVVPNKLLAVIANTSFYQIEEFKNSSLVVILHCLNSFQHNNYGTFTIHIYCLGKTWNAFCFPSFHNGCNPACKRWHRLSTREYMTIKTTRSVQQAPGMGIAIFTGFFAG